MDSGNGQKAGILFVTDVSPNLSDDSGEGGFVSDFEDENPADELNYLVVPSAQSSPASESSGNNTSTPLYFGYPDCATIYQPLGSLAGGEKGDQFSLNLPFERENRTDEWCRDEKNNIPPALSFEVHLAYAPWLPTANHNRFFLYLCGSGPLGTTIHCFPKRPFNPLGCSS